MLSPAWSHASGDGTGTEGAPIDLTGSEEKHHLRSCKVKGSPNEQDQMFSDTSDDEPPAPLQRVLDLNHSSDDVKEGTTTSSSEQSTSVIADQYFLNIGFPSICVFAGRSL